MVIAIGLRPDLLDPAADEVFPDRLRVDLLQPPGRRRVVQLGRLGQQRLRVIEPGPQALQVQRREPAELADSDRGGGRDDAVHRRHDQRQVEPVRVDLPGDRDLVLVPGPPGRHDADLVERVRAPAALAPPDLHHAHIALPPLCIRNCERVPDGPARPACLASPAAVVRRFGHHLDVVRVAFYQPGTGDLGEPRSLQFRDRPCTAVPHGSAQPSGSAGPRRPTADRGTAPDPPRPRARACPRAAHRPGSTGPWSTSRRARSFASRPASPFRGRA